MNKHNRLTFIVTQWLFYLLISTPLVFGYEIAIVKSRQLDAYTEAIAGIRAGLTASKEDMVVTDYDLEGKEDLGYEISQRILNRKTHLVFSVGTEAAHALVNRIGTIPLVVTMIHDPAKEFNDKKNPSGSLYGIPLKVPVNAQVDLIKELAPQLTTLAVDCGAFDKEGLTEIKTAIQEREIGIQCISIDEKGEIMSQLAAAKEKSSAFYFILPDEPYHKTTIQEILIFSARSKYPIVTFSPAYVRSGALMSFSYDFNTVGVEAARLAVQILSGTQITKRFRYVKNVLVSWNQNVSNACGIPLPKKKDITIQYL